MSDYDWFQTEGAMKKMGTPIFTTDNKNKNMDAIQRNGYASSKKKTHTVKDYVWWNV